MIGRRYWLILFKLAVTISAAVGDDDGITYVQGAGASFPNALYQDAIRVYNFVDPEVKVSYTSMGSGNGKCRITDWEVCDALLVSRNSPIFCCVIYLSIKIVFFLRRMNAAMTGHPTISILQAAIHSFQVHSTIATVTYRCIQLWLER